MSGSVVVTLHPSYLETLGVGDHTLAAQFDDGNDAMAAFTVKDATASSGGAGSSAQGDDKTKEGSEDPSGSSDPSSQGDDNTNGSSTDNSGSSSQGDKKTDGTSTGSSGSTGTSAQSTTQTRSTGTSTSKTASTGDALPFALPIALALGGIALVTLSLHARRKSQ
ncbi:MAG: hypothetical protein IKF78_12475 [Atopobiaceae bacterium]|nr:hypothetical protein [Atopobiaceae bacterium]